MTSLPIESVTPELLHLIQENDCILTAPPGAGKSTYLPLKLLSLSCFAEKKILLLQPRQVAVRSIAHFLASSIGENVGQSIGYQMRGESSVSNQTRLCVITEGLLVAKLQSDPELSDVGLIIFDEFHERSVQSDIALGLSLEVQSALRDDLRLLIMSATLNVSDVSKLMPKAQLLSSSGRTYPIDYFYRLVPARNNAEQSSNSNNIQLINAVVNTVQKAHKDHSGNILVFLSGAATIKKVQNALESLHLTNTFIAPLYGALTTEQQKCAIDLPPNNQRKIVLATNIAETSLTINGVNIVVDSGREKVQRFIVSRKLHQLSEQMISKASSVQRAGRAGRQQAGYCYRLWSQEQQQFLQENAPAQITQVDISQTLLTLLEWGTDFAQLPLIDKPSKAQIDYALALLTHLKLVDKQGQINAQGKRACRFNTHPRLARILVNAQSKNERNYAVLCAMLVALVESKPLTLINSNDIVFQCRYVLTQFSSQNAHKSLSGLYKEVSRIANQLGVSHLKRSLFSSLVNNDDLAGSIAQILLSAFPDKIGRKRETSGFTITDGTGASPMHSYEDVQATWIICTQTQISQSTVATLRQYCELSTAALDSFLEENSYTEKQQYWDNSLAKVVCREIVKVGAIEISRHVCSFTPDDETMSLLLTQIRKKGLYELLGKANKLLTRIALFEQQGGPCAKGQTSQLNNDAAHSSLVDSMHTWLAPYLAHVTSWQQVCKLDYLTIVRSTMNYSQLQLLDEQIPEVFVSPLNNRHSLDYAQDGTVSLSIRIQELYGVQEHPTVGSEKLPITLLLLSPAQRLIQKTADLPNFWRGSYLQVQKDMKGQYPRHYWPDSPENAVPTTKTKKKM